LPAAAAPPPNRVAPRPPACQSATLPAWPRRSEAVSGALAQLYIIFNGQNPRHQRRVRVGRGSKSADLANQGRQHLATSRGGDAQRRSLSERSRSTTGVEFQAVASTAALEEGDMFDL